MHNKNVYGGFLQALFFSGGITVPKFLLDHYSELGISDKEMLFIIHLLAEYSNNNSSNLTEKISEKMSMSLDQINNIIKHLENRNLLSVNKQWDAELNSYTIYYDLNGLIDQLFEIWGINQFKKIEASSNRADLNSKEIKESSLQKLTSIFEQELGRPLTGFECEHIEKWLNSSHPEELIIEALKRGVSAGIRNFRYLDSILREWEKKGIRTLLEVETEDANFQARQQKKKKAYKIRTKKLQSESKNKYDNIYL